MKRFLLILSCAALVAACSQEDEVLPNQQKEIVNYLHNSHDPRLISEQEVSESLEQKPEYYTPLGSTVYRYIRNFYDEDRRQRPEVEWGDLVSLTYRAYMFANKAPTLDQLYDTNDSELEGEVMKEGLTGGWWRFGEPYMLRLGETPTLDGIELALPGCRELDTVELYMTYTMAYDKELMYNIPYKSAVVWYISIDKVEK